MLPFARQLMNSWIRPRPHALFWYYANRALKRQNPKPITLTIRYPNGVRQKLTWTNTDDARESLRMFSSRNPWLEYPLPKDAKFVVDLGANIGLSSLYWASCYPQAKLISVEMDPTNAGRCRKLVEENGCNASVAQIAITARNGTMTYRKHSSHSRHVLDSFREGTAAVEGEEVHVTTMTLRELMKTSGIDQIDLLKVDIEGAEHYLLDTIDDWAESVNAMLMELHHNIVYDDAVAKIRRAGFTIMREDKTLRSELFCIRK